jgi:hypothetical protein
MCNPNLPAPILENMQLASPYVASFASSITFSSGLNLMIAATGSKDLLPDSLHDLMAA